MLDGAMSIGDEEPGSIIWLDGRQFTDLQFEFWEKRARYRNGIDNDDE